MSDGKFVGSDTKRCPICHKLVREHNWDMQVECASQLG